MKAKFEGPVRRMPGWAGRSIPLTLLLLVALLTTERRPGMLARPPDPTPEAAVVLSPLPSSTPTLPATPTPTRTPSLTPRPRTRKTVTPPPTRTQRAPDQLAAPANRKTPSIPSSPTIPSTTPARTATPPSTSTPTVTPGATPTSARGARPTYTPSLIPTPTADAGERGSQDRSYVPAAYEDTSLGRAIREYNATHPRGITMHVVSSNSTGVEGAMYRDLIARRLRIMGPEDFAGSVQLPGWPYIVIAIEEDLNANSVTGWRYVLDHERVHMVAAANLAAEGVNLAQLMRQPDGTFTHEALFHEVCADFFPRDQGGNHRPVASFYGAMNRMPELLRVLKEVGVAGVTHQPPPHYEILPITGLAIMDAACVWDREAMRMVRELYDGKMGPGAFDVLLPTY